MREHSQAIAKREVHFRPLAELFGECAPHASTYAGWIANRNLLLNRKWSPASMAALHVAKAAVQEAGWSAPQCRDAALVVATSRGNAAGWLAPWPGRRPFRLMAASNSIHSEPCTAVSIELGIAGPNQVLASGCSAGLDAIGMAMLMVRAGLADRALAVAVDLPLVPLLLDQYAASGILSCDSMMDPYHPASTGFIPSEGAAAMAIERGSEHPVSLVHYGCNSDACDPVGVPSDGGRSPLLFEALAHGPPPLLCPHATGTKVQAAAERAILRRVYGDHSVPSLILLKPYVGHCIGASGLLECAILADHMRRRMMPGNLPNLTAPHDYHFTATTDDISADIVKLAHGMGGHNALLLMRASS